MARNQLGNPVLESLRKKLREHMNSFSDNMSTGGCRDYAEYQFHVGVIHGLALAERDLIDEDTKLTER